MKMLHQDGAQLHQQLALQSKETTYRDLTESSLRDLGASLFLTVMILNNLRIRWMMEQSYQLKVLLCYIAYLIPLLTSKILLLMEFLKKLVGST